MTLTLTFGRYLQKQKFKVSWVCRIYDKKIILIGAKLWAVGGVTDKQTNKQTNKQTDRQTDKRYWPIYFAKFFQNSQSNERALGECILCKIGLTDWVIYLLDWQWQRSRTQSIGPNDSNEKCAMSRVLFRINIAAIQKIRDLDLLHLTLTSFWPWYLTLRLIYYYIDSSKKKLMLWRKQSAAFPISGSDLELNHNGNKCPAK